MAYASRMEEVRLRVQAMMREVDLDAAARRCGFESAAFEAFAEGCLRLGQIEAAEEWIRRAAESALAEETVKVVAEHREAIRDLVKVRRRKAALTATAEAKKEADDRARRQKWALQRQREKLRGSAPS